MGRVRVPPARAVHVEFDAVFMFAITGKKPVQ